MPARLLRSLVLASVLPAAAPGQAGGFIVRLGDDTVAIERYQRSGNRIEGTVLRRTPATTLVKYALTLNTDGTVAAYEQSSLRADGTFVPNAPVPYRMTFSGDSVIREIAPNGQAATLRSVGPRGTLPAIGLSWLANELMVQAARRGGPVHVIGFAPNQTAPTAMEVRLVGDDSAEIVQAGFRTGMRLDPNGRIVRGDGSLTTQKFIVTPLASADLGAIASAWAARDAAGTGMGVASPRDTVNATIGGAAIWIDYGRPARRGREIWGKLVPYDTTWRLGANAATQFRTDRDLVMGGVTVPAGMYTLWLHPTAKGAWIVVNRQTGQWGTMYDAKQDVARIPLVPHMSLPVSEERFRIFVQGDVLMLHWDKGGYGVQVVPK